MSAQLSGWGAWTMALGPNGSYAYGTSLPGTLLLTLIKLCSLIFCFLLSQRVP